MSTLRKLIDSSSDLADPSLLSERLSAEGYLFFRGLLDMTLVNQVRVNIMAILRAHHVIEADGVVDPLWSGGPQPTESEYMAFYEKVVKLDSFNTLAESNEIVHTLQRILGDPVQAWRQRLFRVIYPTPDAPPQPMNTGAHQDGAIKFGYSAKIFYTCWLPLIEIAAEVGGLALVPRSNRHGVLALEGTVASSHKDPDQQGASGVFLDVSDHKWASAEYMPGDAVFFTNLTIHRGLPNLSNRIRMSCDFRYQPQNQSASWIARTPGPDVRRIAQRLDETIVSRALYVTTGATGEILEEVRWLMLQEKSTSLERAQEVVAEIRARRN